MLDIDKLDQASTCESEPASWPDDGTGWGKMDTKKPKTGPSWPSLATMPSLDFPCSGEGLAKRAKMSESCKENSAKQAWVSRWCHVFLWHGKAVWKAVWPKMGQAGGQDGHQEGPGGCKRSPS